MNNLSQIICNARVTDPLKDRSRYVAASIKNPFTMSKKRANPAITTRGWQDRVFISGEMVGVPIAATA